MNIPTQGQLGEYLWIAWGKGKEGDFSRLCEEVTEELHGKQKDWRCDGVAADGAWVAGWSRVDGKNKPRKLTEADVRDLSNLINLAWVKNVAPEAAVEYEERSLERPTTAIAVDVHPPKGVLTVLGRLHAITYEGTVQGTASLFEHTFGIPGSEPDLMVDDANTLHLVGGHYEITDRGIEDLPSPGTPGFVSDVTRLRLTGAPAREAHAREEARGRRMSAFAGARAREEPTDACEAFDCPADIFKERYPGLWAQALRVATHELSDQALMHVAAARSPSGLRGDLRMGRVGVGAGAAKISPEDFRGLEAFKFQGVWIPLLRGMGKKRKAGHWAEAELTTEGKLVAATLIAYGSHLGTRVPLSKLGITAKGVRPLVQKLTRAVKMPPRRNGPSDGPTAKPPNNYNEPKYDPEFRGSLWLATVQHTVEAYDGPRSEWTKEIVTATGWKQWQYAGFGDSWEIVLPTGETVWTTGMMGKYYIIGRAPDTNPAARKQMMHPYGNTDAEPRPLHPYGNPYQGPPNPEELARQIRAYVLKEATKHAGGDPAYLPGGQHYGAKDVRVFTGLDAQDVSAHLREGDHGVVMIYDGSGFDLFSPSATYPQTPESNEIALRRLAAELGYFVEDQNHVTRVFYFDPLEAADHTIAGEVAAEFAAHAPVREWESSPKYAAMMQQIFPGWTPDKEDNPPAAPSLQSAPMGTVRRYEWQVGDAGAEVIQYKPRAKGDGGTRVRRLAGLYEEQRGQKIPKGTKWLTTVFTHWDSARGSDGNQKGYNFTVTAHTSFERAKATAAPGSSLSNPAQRATDLLSTVTSSPRVPQGLVSKGVENSAAPPMPMDWPGVPQGLVSKGIESSAAPPMPMDWPTTQEGAFLGPRVTRARPRQPLDDGA